MGGTEGLAAMEKGTGSLSASGRCRSIGGDSPTEHEDGAGRGVVGQREGLLETELLAAAIEAIRAVDPFGVVVATSAILHGSEVLGALQQEMGRGKVTHGSSSTPTSCHSPVGALPGHGPPKSQCC